jgi:hypothetical protein
MHLCSFHYSHNKQLLFPETAVAAGLCDGDSVFSVRLELILYIPTNFKLLMLTENSSAMVFSVQRRKHHCCLPVQLHVRK